MADSRHLEKSKYFRPILTKFGIVMRLPPQTPSANKILRFQKSKMVAAAIFKKNKKIAISP